LKAILASVALPMDQFAAAKSMAEVMPSKRFAKSFKLNF
jgi:hypothetical protein